MTTELTTEIPTTPDGLAESVGIPQTVEDAYHVRNNLTIFVRGVFAYRDWLDDIIARDMAERGGLERVVDGIVYTFEGDSGWLVENPQAMVNGLSELVTAGEITHDDFEGIVSVVTPEPVIRFSHAKLNTLSKRRGGRVAAVIEQHRRRVESPPKLRMK